MSDETKPKQAKKGPDLDTPAGLKELLRVLRPLAVTYNEARLEEAQRWSVQRERSHVTPDGTEGYAEAREATDVTIRARRELADTLTRMVLRGHAADCPCTLCLLERRTLEGLPVRVEPPNRRRKDSKKGGGRG
jgi:hypothetical protein